MDKGLISVIVPVYNGEKTLKRCIQAIKNQKYGDIEIIIVDDGSTDSSAECAVLYALELSEDNLPITVINTEHRGVSAARNTGIDNAVGEFISFIDCDDEIDSEMLSVTAGLLKNGEVQLAVVGIERVGGGYREFEPYDEENELVFIENAARLYMKPMYFNSCSNKLYITSVIKENRIRFSEDVHIGEDFLFNAEYVRHIRRTAVVSRPLYTYYMSGETVKPFENAYRFDIIHKMYKAVMMLAADDDELRLCIRRKIYEEYVFALRLYCMGNTPFGEKAINVKRVLKSGTFKEVSRCGERVGGTYGFVLKMRSAAVMCAYFSAVKMKNKKK